ncbi:hypothetical protein RB623_15760 [Mesorhizobium sp. LHD-90]|uniref:hypothetical protein n=1 Tax=Mesorhizobium sp. LHD-90 TaxID=3071414 RepID=UPI0027DFA968|nr:hypothetical protein [Mesorhizobium sp. LHD-90]MDQ6435514.1 hypothetical protein [Mesorhizobium sp. LHD-90]
MNITSTAKISRRPSSIREDKTHFAVSGSDEKLPTGPMIGCQPGFLSIRRTLYGVLAQPCTIELADK